MDKKTTGEDDQSVPKPSLIDTMEEGQNKAYRVMSFVDSIRYMVDWIKGLFGR